MHKAKNKEKGKKSQRVETHINNLFTQKLIEIKEICKIKEMYKLKH